MKIKILCVLFLTGLLGTNIFAQYPQDFMVDDFNSGSVSGAWESSWSTSVSANQGVDGSGCLMFTDYKNSCGIYTHKSAWQENHRYRISMKVKGSGNNAFPVVIHLQKVSSIPNIPCVHKPEESSWDTVTVTNVTTEWQLQEAEFVISSPSESATFGVTLWAWDGGYDCMDGWTKPNATDITYIDDFKIIDLGPDGEQPEISLNPDSVLLGLDDSIELTAIISGDSSISTVPDITYKTNQIDIKYGEAENDQEQTEELFMDYYCPAVHETVLKPTVILVHGGGWKGGDKNDTYLYNPMSAKFAEAGYVVFNINYRLLTTYVVTAPDSAAADVLRALDYIKAHSDEYGVDTTKIFVGGDSAGATACVYAAYENPSESNFIGVFDLWGGNAPDGMTFETGGVWNNPIYPNTVPANAPPTLVIHGDADVSVPIQTSNDFDEQLTTADIEHEMNVLVGGTHWDYARLDEYFPWMLTFANNTVNSSTNSNANVNWNSTNSSVATVSDLGFVDAVAEGVTWVFAETKDGEHRDSCKVEVTSEPVPVSDVSVNPTSKTLELDETVQLTAIVSPWNATDKAVTWSSDNEAVATVSESGLVTAVSGGTATITASSVDDGSIKGVCTCTVDGGAAAVTGVTVSPTSVTIAVGETITLTPTVLPENAGNKKVYFSSSNNNVVFSHGTGEITGKEVGEARIVISTQEGSFTTNCYVTVTAATSVKPETQSIVNIYPNPVNDILHIILNNNSYSNRITLMNIAGKLMYQQVVCTGDHTIDCSSYPQGIYILQVASEE